MLLASLKEFLLQLLERTFGITLSLLYVGFAPILLSFPQLVDVLEIFSCLLELLLELFVFALKLLCESLGLKHLASFFCSLLVPFINLGQELVTVSCKDLVFFLYIAQLLAEKIHLPL